MSKELKIFCDKFKLDFPEFKLVYLNSTIMKYNVVWYNQYILCGIQGENRQEVLLSAINLLSQWLDSDINFIDLLTLQKMSIKYP